MFFVNIVKIIKHHDIEGLLKNFNMETLILFDHSFGQWRESSELPFRSSIQPMFYQQNLNNPPSPTLSSATFKAHTPPNRFTPYERPLTSDDVQNLNDTIQLAKILNETSRGKILVEYYNKIFKFEDEQRASLIVVIAFYFEEKRIKITLSAIHQMKRQILERFLTEKLEYYRASKRGKIYTKFCNLASSFKINGF